MNIKNIKTKYNIKLLILLILSICLFTLLILIYKNIEIRPIEPVNITNYSEDLTVLPNNSCTKALKESPNDINVVTYNIGACGEDCPTKNRVFNFKKLLVETNFADIIGFQEIQVTNTGSKNEIEPIKEYFPGYNFVYRGHQDPEKQPIGQMNSGEWYGNMILTKFPIRANSYIQQIVDKTKGDSQWPRYYISVILETPSGPLRVYNIHTRAGGESQWGVTQVSKFIQQVSGSEPEIPFIVLGDFNQGIEYIKSQLGDQQYNLNIDFECKNPNMCFIANIDHIFSNNMITMLNKCQGTRKIGGGELAGDHVPVYGTIRINQIPNTQPKCVGFNIYDNSNSFPNVITDQVPVRRLTDTITIRTAANDKEGIKQNQICWAPDKLKSTDYLLRGNWVCAAICPADNVSGSVCDDQVNFSGHVTNTLEGFILKFATDSTKSLARSNGLLFITNILEIDKVGAGMCSTSPAYSESGGYFSKEVLQNNIEDGNAFQGVDTISKCGVAADGNNCIRKVQILNNTSSPTPNSSPTITDSDKIKYDLNLDGEIDIQDFIKFVEYYKASDCKIDYNNNNNCKDIEDFKVFVAAYKQFQ